MRLIDTETGADVWRHDVLYDLSGPEPGKGFRATLKEMANELAP